MSNVMDEFNERLEAFIDKYGIARATNLLDLFTKERADKEAVAKRNELLLKFLQLETLSTFEVDSEEFKEAKTKLSKEARWALVHLMKTYTRASYTEISEKLKIKPRAAKYAVEKCNEMIEVGKFERVFNERYMELEEKLVAFIAKV